MTETTFHEKLKTLMDEYAHGVYRVTKKFPKDEIYGITSQFRRSSLSVILNYIEGYARMGKKTDRYFLEISYGSLQESKYLTEFCYKESYLQETDFKELYSKADQIGKMLWGVLKKINPV